MHLGDLRLPRRLIVLPLALALVAAGCGGGSTGNGTTSPTASAPEATAPPPDATQPGTGATTTPPAATGPAGETDPSTSTDREVPDDRGGDEGDGTAGGGKRNVRVRASFTMTSAGHVTPRTITVPAFIAIQLTLHVPDEFAQLGAHALVVETPEERRLDVYYRQHTNTLRLPGQRPGRYRVKLDRVPAATLIVGGEPGP
jgi:hypothetical protein